MRHVSLILAALSLCVVLLGAAILVPVIEEVREYAEAMEAPAEELIEEPPIEVAQLFEEPPIEAGQPDTVKFDLKYDKYLVPEPYTYDADGEPRAFRFEKMVEALQKADEEFSRGRITYVDNYKNRKGDAPYYYGKNTDQAGGSRSASAPGYPDISDKKEFCYIPDGALVRVIREDEGFVKVVLVESDKIYYIPAKYVRTDDCLTALDKAIVVDRSNQNIATFEKRDPGGWTVVSYSLATTGKVGKYYQPTPLGYFYAIEKRERFYYLFDGTDEVEGYAPYAIRFTAGAYIHGIGVAFRYSEDGSRITPGIQEFSRSIGTVPLSHKCVRNYTSHAKFIYDWYVHGETIVVVIE
ncbi:MAG: L,D-transpeptidase [Clostridiales bacterium]|nr:L,D-transpeptidase [Clostridiales bacterium]